ncbi:unnamed protein product [Fraxinus pennsylvanica]|uniref:Uncharacterized protein n=1 Tax=Fraxinus pennsylvanica TaxID=56036 RepID=A0AAD1YUB0_9LAMI|nr:unnamed protein product [Fraxinus pennsylvanica]
MQSEITNRPPIWDCGSSLYDSFDKKAFEKLPDSAINSRTLSMPYLSDRHLRLSPQILYKKTSKLSWSFISYSNLFSGQSRINQARDFKLLMIHPVQNKSAKPSLPLQTKPDACHRRRSLRTSLRQPSSKSVTYRDHRDL